MRVRDFLRGFSVGMIFTCLVLFIVFKGSNQISDEYVIERAKQLNMVFQNEDSSFLKQDTEVNDNTASQDEKDDDIEKNTSNETTSEPKSEDSSEEGNSNQQNAEEKSDEKTTEEMVTINISKGMSSGDVSEMLYELKVIDDKQEFSMYLHDNGYSLKVKIGEFEIPMDASYEEIAKIITKS